MTWYQHDDERLLIEELLPWYVTGRLSDTERRKVEAYLEANPEAAISLAIAREDASLAVEVSEALPGPRPQALDDLMRSLPPQPGLAFTRPSLLQRLGEWVAGLTPNQIGIAAAALCTVLLAQAVTIGTLMRPGHDVYETATGPSSGAMENTAVLLIGFKPEATMADTTTFLKDNHLTVIDGPRAGLYRVRAKGDTPVADLVAQLEASAVVATVMAGR